MNCLSLQCNTVAVEQNKAVHHPAGLSTSRGTPSRRPSAPVPKGDSVRWLPPPQLCRARGRRRGWRTCTQILLTPQLRGFASLESPTSGGQAAAGCAWRAAAAGQGRCPVPPTPSRAAVPGAAAPPSGLRERHSRGPEAPPAAPGTRAAELHGPVRFKQLCCPPATCRASQGPRSRGTGKQSGPLVSWLWCEQGWPRRGSCWHRTPGSSARLGSAAAPAPPGSLESSCRRC